jgi:pimeloyl-ACP methyl ester carboxylesterase
MGMTLTRRSLLSGFGTALGAQAIAMCRADALAVSRAAQKPTPATTDSQYLHVPFGRDGHLGTTKESQAYLEQLVKAAVVSPLSDIIIYAHGWLTDVNDLMVIYDYQAQHYDADLRALSQRGFPTTRLVFMIHWPSRRTELGGPIDIADISSFSTMEARANLVGRVGMAALIRLVWERLLADPNLTSTRVTLVGHSFGARVLTSALHALPAEAPEAFRAVQTRNPLVLTMLEPAMPADVLEPDDLAHAHPFAQLVHYQNLRILTTMSRWDTPLVRFYPAQEAEQPADAQYALLPAGSRRAVPALGGAGPTEATWRAFNGALPWSAIAVPPGFQVSDVPKGTGQRLTVADLTPLHTAHRREDFARPEDELPPFGRPNRRSMALAGYHNDIYGEEVRALAIGHAFGTIARSGGL